MACGFPNISRCLGCRLLYLIQSGHVSLSFDYQVLSESQLKVCPESVEKHCMLSTVMLEKFPLGLE